MSTAVTTFEGIQNTIKDRIKGEFISLIPDEAWTGLVQGVIDDFTKSKRLGDPSPLQQLITDEIKVIAKQSIAAQLNKLDASAWSAYGEKTANDAVIALVTEHMPAIMSSIQTSMANMMVMNALAKIRQGGY